MPASAGLARAIALRESWYFPTAAASTTNAEFGGRNRPQAFRTPCRVRESGRSEAAPRDGVSRCPSIGCETGREGTEPHDVKPLPGGCALDWPET